MDTETKVLIGIGAAFVGTVAICIGLEVRKSKKQTAAILEQAAKEIAIIKDRTIEHRIAHEARMLELAEEDAAMQRRHQRVMKALALMKAEHLKFDKKAGQILDDLAKGYITAAQANDALRDNGKAAKVAVTRRRSNLHAVA